MADSRSNPKADGSGGGVSGAGASGEAPSRRTKVRRMAERGSYEADLVRAILEEGIVAHVGFATEDGPCVLPMAYGVDGDHLYLHGAVGNAMLRHLTGQRGCCVTVTLTDALVLARSAFHHSINYRSVVIFGHAQAVSDPEEKGRALMVIVDHVVPGRGADVRPPSDSELLSTRVLRLGIAEASAKVRTGGSVTEPEDSALGVWSGQIPLSITTGAPEPDEISVDLRPIPDYATNYSRPGW